MICTLTIFTIDRTIETFSFKLNKISGGWP